ncbi:hypothetical protein GCK32_000353 [Trichostrongylus colubriformis]|uniref:Uncharacterized protein n=1 Tax=Trichostrongylus colubriformis TaxID=6319 RepID=A0AAN8ISL2_TRICO
MILLTDLRIFPNFQVHQDVIAVARLYLAITIREVSFGLPAYWWNEYIGNLSNHLIDEVLDFSLARKKRNGFHAITSILGQTPNLLANNGKTLIKSKIHFALFFVPFALLIL